MRIPKTLTLEDFVIADLERTKGNRSTSDRANNLLKFALEMERQKELEEQAATFYSVANRKERREEKALQKASRRSIARD